MPDAADPLAGVSRETLERLELFADLLAKWTRKINLIAPSTAGDIWDRHIRDSAQLWSLAPADATSWADLGSGGGLPGLVIASLAAEDRPDLHAHLVESDQRKAAFLRTAKQAMGLRNVTIHAKRAESLPALHSDVVSARALAPLPDLLSLVARHLRPGGCALLPKGRSGERELAEARQIWCFEVQQTPSITDREASILKLERISRRA